jgi:hypothetical protein
MKTNIDLLYDILVIEIRTSHRAQWVAISTANRGIFYREIMAASYKSCGTRKRTLRRKLVFVVSNLTVHVVINWD